MTCTRIGCQQCERDACPECGRVDCASAVQPMCVECERSANRMRTARVRPNAYQLAGWGFAIIEVLDMSEREARHRRRAA